MNLSDFLQYGSKKYGSRSAEAARTPIYVTTPGGAQPNHLVKTLTPGMMLQGEIVDKSGNEIRIKLDKDVVITARLEKDINLSVGQNVTFEVKSQPGTQIALRPLYENLTQDANVLKALEAAKLPITDSLVRMVSFMMEQGMSIDKNALLNMGKLITVHAEAAPETIVAMRSLKFPITAENIEQFENYRSYRHQILSSVTDFLSELPSAFQAMLKEGQTDTALNFYKQVLQLFSQAAVQGQGNEEMIPNASEDIAGNAKENIQVSGRGSGADTLLHQTEGKMAESVINLTGEAGEGAAAGTSSNKAADSMNIIQNSVLQNDTLLEVSLDQNGRNTLVGLLEQLGFSKQQLMQVADGKLPVSQLLQDIHHVIAERGENVSRESMTNLFGSRVYNQLLNNEILHQWLVKPSDVGQKNNVEEFYGRLKEQTTKLTDALNQIAKDIPISKSLTVMRNNIDFMHQINQAFNYIQLPLKMSGGNAHGDLYVYTNKRNAPKEDGSVSALLHLDMTNLGTMDVYVTMREKNVNTKFYLKDEQTIAFIAEHIHILSERLSKRGYSMNAEMLVNTDINKENGMDVIEAMSEQEKRESILSQYSFDVRA